MFNVFRLTKHQTKMVEDAAVLRALKDKEIAEKIEQRKEIQKTLHEFLALKEEKNDAH